MSNKLSVRVLIIKPSLESVVANGLFVTILISTPLFFKAVITSLTSGLKRLFLATLKHILKNISFNNLLSTV